LLKEQSISVQTTLTTFRSGVTTNPKQTSSPRIRFVIGQLLPWICKIRMYYISL